MNDTSSSHLISKIAAQPEDHRKKMACAINHLRKSHDGCKPPGFEA
jgi:hypothetical protein